MRYVFPAIFSPDKDNHEYICVGFPDLKGCVTYGIGLAEAVTMAKDALKTFLETDVSARHITPSDPYKVQRFFKEYLVVLIAVDIDDVVAVC